MPELASVLRAWRDRVSPAEAGLPSGGDRRSPGLRREELASLAGLSVDYIVRLEQGRATNPSAQVLGSLARALRLTDDERDHLYRVAGTAVPTRAVVPRHVTPGVQRLLDHLGDLPMSVFSASWDSLLNNPLWTALFGETPVGSREANLVWRQFTSPPTNVSYEDGHGAEFRHDLVADLHKAAGLYPADAVLLSLVADLRERSPEFDELWDSASIAVHRESRKRIDTASIGPIELYCDVLAVPGTDMKIVVYSAVPGSSDAAALDLLRVAGVQQFAH